MKLRKWLPNKPRRLSSLIALCVLAMLGMLYHHLHQPSNSTSYTHTATHIANSAPHPSVAQHTINNLTQRIISAPGRSPWIAHTIKPGASLASILQPLHLSANQIYKISQLPHVQTMIKQLRPQQTISIQRDMSGQMTGLRYQLNPTQTLNIKRSLPGPTYSSFITTTKTENSNGMLAGPINNSLDMSMQAAGASPKLRQKFKNIFSWRINFKRDLHKGDAFAMLYQKQTAKGRTVSNGPILIAELISRKKTYVAVRFKQNRNYSYFTTKGQSLQGQFLKTPVKYKRISSPFSLRRWHPVLKIWRPHYGVDLAAPQGTPIHSAADGTITRIQMTRGYGNVIYIQHNAVYSTRYAHMQRFAKGLRRYSKVKRGQVIGYVGQTGVSTGPHLHYEIRKYGIPKNPMTIKLPSAPPIARYNRATFKKVVTRNIKQLGGGLKQAIDNQPSAHQRQAYKKLLNNL